MYFCVGIFIILIIERHLCHHACLAPQLEMSGWSRERTRPADVLGSW